MIHCQRCKAQNPPTQTSCQNCGADLLPGIGRGNRIAVLVLGVFAALALGILAVMALPEPEAEGMRCVVNTLLLGAALMLGFSLLRGLGKTPLAARYRMRAGRHVPIDPEQAFADYTKAVEHNSSDLASWKARGLLYDKVDLGIPALQDEIRLLSGAMVKEKEQVKGELASQTVRLYEKLIHGLGSTGESQELVRSQLRLFDFMERNVGSLVQFKTDTVGFGTGVTLSIRRDMKKQIREARQSMARAGLVRAIGTCPICGKEVVATPDLQCPNYETHKHLRDLRFVMPDEVDAAMATPQGTG